MVCCVVALGFTMLVYLPDINNNDKVRTKYVPDSMLSALIGYLHSYKNPVTVYKSPH